jgi:hypothetical protein
MESNTRFDWERELASVQCCHFLPLRNDVVDEEEQQFQTTRVISQSAGQLPEFSDQTGILSSYVFLLAWALVLRSYTSSDQVAFGYSESGRETVSRVCQFILRKSAQVGKIFQDISDSINSKTPQPHCNVVDVTGFSGVSGWRVWNTGISVRQLASTELGKGLENFGNQCLPKARDAPSKAIGSLMTDWFCRMISLSISKLSAME